MKVLAKYIEVISYTDLKGDIRPLRFRIAAEDESVSVIKVDRVLGKELEKLAGNLMYVFKCQGIINNTQKLFELKYELNTCKWMIFKI